MKQLMRKFPESATLRRSDFCGRKWWSGSEFQKDICPCAWEKNGDGGLYRESRSATKACFRFVLFRRFNCWLHFDLPKACGHRSSGCLNKMQVFTSFRIKTNTTRIASTSLGDSLTSASRSFSPRALDPTIQLPGVSSIWLHPELLRVEHHFPQTGWLPYPFQSSPKSSETGTATLLQLQGEHHAFSSTWVILTSLRGGLKYLTSVGGVDNFDESTGALLFFRQLVSFISLTLSLTVEDREGIVFNWVKELHVSFFLRILHGRLCLSSLFSCW